MIENDKFRPALFERLTAEDLRVDASAFACEMQAFVKRIGILHWAIGVDPISLNRGGWV